MSRHALRFDRETGIALGLVPPTATGDSFGVSHGTLTKEIADRINGGPFEVSYCEQTGTATVRRTDAPV